MEGGLGHEGGALTNGKITPIKRACRSRFGLFCFSAM
jgi:hypothetical protein